MEQQELKKRFDKLLAEYQLPQQIERLYQKAVECGALDIAGETGDDYRLAKIIWHAIALKLREESIPYHADNRILAQNLSLFL
jgi:hypothetical protein